MPSEAPIQPRSLSNVLRRIWDISPDFPPGLVSLASFDLFTCQASVRDPRLGHGILAPSARTKVPFGHTARLFVHRQRRHTVIQMTMRTGRDGGGGRGPGLAVRNADALMFAADMYGIQLDQLARLVGDERSARAAVTRWRSLGYAETARLGLGATWVWVTRAGLAACGLAYPPVRPGLSRLAHQGRGRGPHRPGGDERLPRRGRVLAVRAADPVRARRRRQAAPARRRGALAGPGAGGVGRRMLGRRGRTHPEDRRPHHRDHAGDPVPHRGLWLLRRRRGGARPAAQAHPRALPVLPRRAGHGAALPRGTRPALRQDRGQGPPPRRIA